jgi:hypothetical protein
MNRETYRRLYDHLASFEDVHRVAKEEGWDPELLFVIYTHRVTRDATRRFYVVKRQIPRMVGQWRRGRKMLDIAREWRFPPVLMGQMMLSELKIPRKKVWGCFLDPDSAPDPRLRAEIRELLAHDPIYSPDGMEQQRERGRKGEERLYHWLETHRIPYRTEKDLRGKYRKTPDALLDEPIIFYGRKLGWIESKANFGDDVELRKNLRRQLGPYTEMFGEGAVVYWYGYVDGAESPPGILLWDGPTMESITPVLAPRPATAHAVHRSSDLARPRSPSPAPSGRPEAPAEPAFEPPP